ncbi:acyl carrier protein [Amycolatopsis sp. NPDC051128]|jgi:acyl carrier protein|uniref:acyl carrier protein n=1 Tax=Amycolatopsis sp. NPDC051128 TaxID=3155412 RepID=UPI0034126EB0
MPDTELRLKHLLSDVLANGTVAADIGSDADLVAEYGLDSLQMISFLLGVEDEFGVQLDYEHLELDDLRAISHFAAYLGRLAVPG